jgi:hypothetical protein
LATNLILTKTKLNKDYSKLVGERISDKKLERRINQNKMMNQFNTLLKSAQKLKTSPLLRDQEMMIWKKKPLC